MSEDLIKVTGLKKHFPIHGGLFFKQVATVYAVDGVDFTIKAGETLGIVGESGCGKSTLGKTLLRLYDATEGHVEIDNRDLFSLDKKELQKMRRNMQMIFQDPSESLNSRHTVGSIIEEPLIIHNIGTPKSRKEVVRNLLKRVGLPESALTRFPHEFSGGQRQRIGIARAIALKPKLILCDEAVSALDVSVQSQVLNLLLELQQEMNITYVFISHDLSVVKHISDRIAVMYLGKIVEITSSENLYKTPLHPYTQALISSIPEPDPEAKRDHQILEGDIPSPRNPPRGCHFHTRCPYVTDKCKTERPILKAAPNSTGEDHMVSCHYTGDLRK